ncbi:MAG: flagellar hook-associated protein FlgK [Clostridia bacterium]|nr:flagellar hook-associated protein FlgK [Clostridia bacterium]
MSSSFLGLNISLSGLFANQMALSVTSHNVANANTEGYCRQRLDMTQFRPDMVAGLGTLGVGVDVTAVQQIRDEYTDAKLRDETSMLGEWAARADTLAQIEAIFNEPSDSSITQLMEDFYSAIQELSVNPENLTARTLVRQSSIALTDGVNSMSTSLKELQTDLNYEFNNAVEDINRIAEEIVGMNKIIYESELGVEGKNNDVRDQRNVLIDELSEFVEVDYYEDNEGRFHLSVGGHLLVSHFRADSLEVTQRSSDAKINENDADQLYEVRWSDGNKLVSGSGRLKGLQDMRDNIDGDYKGIPYYVDQLDNFVDTLSAEMNRIHQEGYGLDGSTGVAFFTIDGMSTEEFEDYLRTEGLDGGAGVDVTSAVLDGVTEDMDFDERSELIRDNMDAILAANEAYENKSIRLVGDQYLVVDKIKADQLSISSDISDLNKIASAETEDEEPGDGRNMLNLLNTRHNVKLYDWGAPEDFVKSLVSNLGVDANQANNVVSNQELLVNYFETKKESVSGVSLDEEMTNMIKYQNAYSANARMTNVFDEMLDLVVNRLGTVGR